jgi:hypothetical protein
MPPAAHAPQHRPAWLVILSSLMLLAGGYSLVAGMLKLRDPTMILMVGGAETLDSDADVDLNRQLLAARVAAVTPHRSGLRIEAGCEVGLALFTLYATAAVFSRDRRGRALTLAVGLLGIGYQLAVLPLYLALTQDYAARGSALLARSIVETVGPTSADLTPEQITARLHSAIVGGPLVAAAVGIVGSLVLLFFFGGRRGKLLYGIARPPQTERRSQRREDP